MKKNKKILYFILSFIIPIIIFMYLCYLSNIYPFGNILINKYDSIGQYSSFLVEFINKLKFGGNFFYTLHAGCGANFLGIFNLYVASPLNLLFIFFKQNQIYTFYILLIYIKLGLCSFSLFTYLYNVNKNHLRVNLLFTIIYALMSYSIGYSYHIMWLDALYLAPLILLGIDKLINDDKIILYTIFLTVSIIINFYMGYMLCIFSLIYFIYKIILKKGNKKKIIFKFILSSFLCGFLSAFIIIPSGFALINGRSIGENNFISLNLNNLKALFYNLTPASFIQSDNYNDGSCVIYCTLFVISLVIMYFFNKKITLKQKLITLIMIIFFIISFSFNLLDFSWNMFTKPIWWNSRYSYLFSLFLIIIAHDSFLKINDIKMNHKLKLLFFTIFFILVMISMSLKLIGSSPTNIKLIITLLSVALLFTYFTLIPSLKNNLFKFMILLLLIFSEIIYNGYYLLSFDKDSIIYYDKTIKSLNSKIKYIKTLNQKDRSFYRIYDYNDTQEDNGMLIGFNSPLIFSSIYNKKLNVFYSKYMEVNNLYDETINHTQISYPSIELLSLINIKYVIDYNGKFLKKIDRGINEITSALPLGFLIDDKPTIQLDDYQKFLNTEKIYSYLSSTNLSLYKQIDEDITFKNISLSKEKSLKLKNSKKSGKVNLKFTVSNNGLLTPRVSQYFYKYASVLINGKKVDKKDFIEVFKGDKVVITYQFLKDENIDNIYLYDLQLEIFDYQKFITVIHNLKVNNLKIDKNDKDILGGYINVNKNGKKLFLSIPYDKGLIIKIDNEEVKYNEEFDTFISVPVKMGKHKISINYYPQGLKLGIIISLSTLLMIIIVRIYIFCKQKYL